MSPSRVALGALVVAVLLPVAANAAPITRQYTFTGSNVQTTIGSAPPPFSSVTLTFQVTFDPLVQQINAPSGATLIGSNLPLGSAFQHSFVPSNMDRMSVGGAANGTFGIAVINNDFTLDFRNAQSSAPTFDLFQFATSATPGSAFRAFTGPITSTAVSEPAGMTLLMAAGALALGAARRRRA
jgi:hypothetical protein